MGPGRYFGVERRGNCIAVGVARASAACYGVNLGARGFGVGLWVPKIPKWAWDTVRWFQGKGKMYCSWSGGSVFCLLWGEPGGTRFWGWVWVPKIPKWAWNTVRWFQGKGKMYCSWSGGSVFCLLWSEPGSPDWVLAADRSSTMGRAWYFGVGHGWGNRVARRTAKEVSCLLWDEPGRALFGPGFGSKTSLSAAVSAASTVCVSNFLGQPHSSRNAHLVG